MKQWQNADPDLPIALLAAGVFLWFAFQTVQFVHDSQALVVIEANQTQPLEDAAHLREAAESLAADTAQLAQSGDQGAKRVVAIMAQQNVVLRPPEPAKKPPAAAQPVNPPAPTGK